MSTREQQRIWEAAYRKSYELPPGSSKKEPGFDAIRHHWGEDMVQRFLNWPVLARNYALAQYADSESAEKDATVAKANVEKARGNKDYALEQAAIVARKIPRLEWLVVPSVLQLQREWFPPEPVDLVQRNPENDLFNRPSPPGGDAE